ncbi:MAG: hypothetical protein JNM21_16395 [Taibaiella sp.]|nr:hypothetical protein [Taibaiella sp.]
MKYLGTLLGCLPILAGIGLLLQPLTNSFELLYLLCGCLGIGTGTWIVLFEHSPEGRKNERLKTKSIFSKRHSLTS